MSTASLQFQSVATDFGNDGMTTVLPPFSPDGHCCRQGNLRQFRLPQHHRAVVQLTSLIPHSLQAGVAFVPAEGNLSPIYRATKRLLDMAGALGLLLLLGPVMLAVLAVLTVATRGKPLYCQRRVGYRGRLFTMLKFRTMQPAAERMQHHVANEKDGPIFKNRRDPRITRIGRILRKTSLDETPQLFHVLLGQMSLVGPRPLPIHEVLAVSRLAMPASGGHAGADLSLAGERPE